MGLLDFFKKKEEKVERKKVEKDRLNIRMEDGSVIWYTGEVVGKSPKISHWRKFTKWYFGRTSEMVTLPANNGEHVIYRSKIKSVDCERIEVDDNE